MKKWVYLLIYVGLVLFNVFHFGLLDYILNLQVESEKRGTTNVFTAHTYNSKWIWESSKKELSAVEGNAIVLKLMIVKTEDRNILLHQQINGKKKSWLFNESLDEYNQSYGTTIIETNNMLKCVIEIHPYKTYSAFGLSKNIVQFRCCLSG